MAAKTWERVVIEDAMDCLDMLTDWEAERIWEWADYPENRKFTERQQQVLDNIDRKIHGQPTVKYRR